MDSAVWTALAGIVGAAVVSFLSTRISKGIDHRREDKKAASMSDLDYRRQFGADYSKLVKDLSESLQASQEDLRDLRLEFRALRDECEKTHRDDTQKIAALQRENHEQAVRIERLENQGTWIAPDGKCL